MTKRVQILGHDHDTAVTFIGEPRELTVDVDNWNIVVHDGVTPGGWLIYNRDQNDQRYQARSVELDGLLGWEPNERGIVTRLGPANYTLRVIDVEGTNLVVTNPNGYSGNPKIGLKPTISSDHTATGTWTFTKEIKAQGGVLGNLKGNVLGNVEGDLLGNVTGNLYGSAIGDHSGSFTGDVDVRGHDLLMDDGQIQLNWLSAGILDYLALRAVPIGAICAFGGGSLPANWAVCDGSGGTPDLRDRFIVAAGVNFANGSTGGTVEHNHTVTIASGGAHTHTGTIGATALSEAQMPAHRHGNGVTNTDDDLYCYGATASPVSTADSIDDNSSNGTLQGWTETVGGGATHTHTLAVNSGGAHAHTGNTANKNHLPPYYALMYIMRIS